MKKLGLLLIAIALFGCEKENIPPTCEITSPGNDAEYEVGDQITISVEAEDEDGTIEEVSFYIDDLGVGSVTSFPFNYIWDTESEEDGIKKIKVSVKDDRGATVEDEISILLNPGIEPPVAAFTATPTSITEGESVQFTDQSTNAPTEWLWDFGDGSTSTSQNPSHTYSTAGSYEVTLTVMNSAGSNTEIKSGYIIVSRPDITGQTGTLSDSDGNAYNWVGIGQQAWMAENLKATKYNDGTSIPLVTDGNEWTNMKTPGYCWYDNDETTYKNTYGALYNWYTVNTDKLCPAGWHVPTDAEWTELENYLIANGYNYDGTTSGNKIGKSLASTSGWSSSFEVGGVGNDQASNNSTGFSAFPGGRRLTNGSFYSVGDNGGWWSDAEYSSTHAYRRNLDYNYEYLYRYHYLKEYGFSVRCLRD